MTTEKLSERIIGFFDKCCLGNYNSNDASSILVDVKALEVELQRLRYENADWMTKAQSEYILRMKADKRAESRLAEAEEDDDF
jgi:hypothetical protein